MRMSVLPSALILLGLLPMLALPAGAGELDGAIQLFEGRQLDEARKLFEGYAGQHPQDADAAYYLGRVAFEQRRLDTAVTWFEKAAALRPDSSEFQDYLGRAYGNQVKGASFLRQPGLAGKSKSAFERAIALNAANLQAREDLMTYYLSAPFFLGGSVDKAREQAGEIQKRDPARGLEASGSIHVESKEYDRAEADFKSAIQQAPGSPRPRLSLGMLYQQRGRFGEASDTFEGILKLAPQNLDAQYQIGKTGALSGKLLDRAQECLEIYLSRRPGLESPAPSSAHYRLGMVYEKKGNRDQARAQYQAAVRLDPALKEAKEALNRLHG